MESAKTKLTVFFEPPFWTGLIERETGDRYEVCRVIFGAEPSDAEVYVYVLDRYGSLKFSPALEGGSIFDPLDLAHEGGDVLHVPLVRPHGVHHLQGEEHQGGLSLIPQLHPLDQQALQLQREQSKMKRRICSREIRQADEERRYHLRQAKRKEKHRGR